MFYICTCLYVTYIKFMYLNYTKVSQTGVFKTLSAVRFRGLFNPLNFIIMPLPPFEIVNEFYSIQRFDFDGSKVVCFCPSLSDAQELISYLSKELLQEFFVCPVPHKVVVYDKSKKSK